MMNGWQLLMSAGYTAADIEQVCVRVNGDFGEIPVADAEYWLSQMTWFTDHGDDGWIGHPTLDRDEHYEFQVWTRDRIYRTREWDGIMQLISWPRTPELWMRIASRTERGLLEIGNSRIWNHGEPR